MDSLMCALARPGCSWRARLAPAGASVQRGLCPRCAAAVVAEARARVAMAQRLGADLDARLQQALHAGDLLSFTP